MKTLKVGIVAGLILILGGCQNATQKSILEENFKLRQEKKDLEDQVERYKDRTKQLDSRISTLSSINESNRQADIATLNTVELSSRCGIYDRDNNGKKETLLVYIKTIDDTGDVIKAPGSVDIQLWNLSSEPEQSLLKKWHVSPAELKKNWSGTFLTGFYRLKFDVASVIPGSEQLTLKITFTDYITGRTFNAQQVVQP